MAGQDRHGGGGREHVGFGPIADNAHAVVVDRPPLSMPSAEVVHAARSLSMQATSCAVNGPAPSCHDALRRSVEVRVIRSALVVVKRYSHPRREPVPANGFRLAGSMIHPTLRMVRSLSGNALGVLKMAPARPWPRPNTTNKASPATSAHRAFAVVVINLAPHESTCTSVMPSAWVTEGK